MEESSIQIELTKDEIDADEFLDLVAYNPTCYQDFVGMPNTPETHQKLMEFCKKKWREMAIEMASVQPMPPIKFKTRYDKT